MRPGAGAGPDEADIAARRLSHTAELTLVGDLLVPAGAILTVVTAVGTVHWLKGKRRLALLAPLSVVSVFGVVGTARVAKPSSPWARWRYDDDRMAQACARFGEPAPDLPPRIAARGAANAGFGLVVLGIAAGVPFGAVTSLVGGVLLAHAWLARSGRGLSARVCALLAAVTVVGEVVLTALRPADAVPGAATTALVAVGAGVLLVAGRG